MIYKFTASPFAEGKRIFIEIPFRILARQNCVRRGAFRSE